MKRTLSLLLLLFLACSTMLAEGITRTEALQKAKTFLAAKGKNLEVKDGDLAYKAPRLSSKNKNDASYYIFNIGKAQGYVIVSGDDRTAEILGYTESGDYNASQASPEFRAWLAAYADQIKALDEGKLQAEKLSVGKSVKAVTEAAKYPISPLLTSLWNQFEPYNDLAPKYDSTYLSATGCVATAMAQIMYYHKWPAQTTAEIPAYTTQGGLSIAAVPQGKTFSWSNMRDTYNNTSSAASNTAVAELMQACGTSVKMNYGPSSGAPTRMVATALKAYYDYDASTQYLTRDAYSAAQWESLIYTELAHQRPVLYAGQSSGGGHAFVCDGYDGEGYYHINWGWGGYADGYFRLSVMNPGTSAGAGASASKDGYAIGQEIIIGIQPNKNGTAPASTMFSNNYRVAGSTITYAQGNGGSVATSFDLGLAILEADNKLTNFKSNFRANNLPSGNYYPNLSYDLAPYFQSKSAGTYKVVPSYKLATEGADAWKPAAILGKQYFEVVVGNGGAISITAHPILSLQASGFSFPGTKIAGNTQEVVVALQNNSAEEFNGTLYFFASQTTDKGTAANHTGTVVLGNSSERVSFYFTPQNAGAYTLWVSTDNAGNNVIGTGNFTAETPSTEAPNLTVTEIYINNKSGGEVYGKRVSGYFTVKNNGSQTFSQNINAWLLVGNGAGNYSGASNISLTRRIEAGGINQYDFDFLDLEQDKSYMLLIRYDNTELKRTIFTLKQGVICYTAEGIDTGTKGTATYVVPEHIAAVDFTGSGVTTITPNSNPNTLYIFGESEAVPASLVGKNVVKGMTAEHITLEDGKNFFTPITFTATNIVYVRTVGVGSNGREGGWETFTLPFSPETIQTAEGKVLTWQKERDGAGNFWLKEYAGIDENEYVYFKYTDAIEAYRPYIIAFPGDAVGKKLSLAGKTIQFSAQNASIKANQLNRAKTSAYRYIGTLAAGTLPAAYTMNAEGTAFEVGASPNVTAFRAYFEAVNPSGSGTKRLLIGSWDEPITSIQTLAPTADDGVVRVYNLAGKLVLTTTVKNGVIDFGTLPHGIYIVNGRKVVL